MSEVRIYLKNTQENVGGLIPTEFGSISMVEESKAGIRESTNQHVTTMVT